MNESMRGARRFLAARKSSAVGIVGVVVLVMIATMATTSASDTGRSGESITLYAESEDAGALIKGNDVRMYGVKIGVIGDLEVVRNDTAKMTLELTSAQTPIHTDATLRVRPVSLLGERYLELDPGSADAPRAEDGFIFPAEQVSRSVDLDEVLDTVDDPTGTALSALVQTLGDGLAGNGDSTAEAISAMGPSMKQANELVTLLSGQTATLQQLIDALDPVVAAVGTKDGASVDSLIDSADRLLSATSGQQAALRATLEELPSTLVTAQKTLARLSGLADEATPALKSARPFTDDLDQIADEAIDFTDAASPAIATLKPAGEGPRSRRASHTARRPAQQQSPSHGSRRGQRVTFPQRPLRPPRRPSGLHHLLVADHQRQGWSVALLPRAGDRGRRHRYLAHPSGSQR